VFAFGAQLAALRFTLVRGRNDLVQRFAQPDAGAVLVNEGVLGIADRTNEIRGGVSLTVGAWQADKMVPLIASLAHFGRWIRAVGSVLADAPFVLVLVAFEAVRVRVFVVRDRLIAGVVEEQVIRLVSQQRRVLRLGLLLLRLVFC